jgi:hypothetical protein
MLPKFAFESTLHLHQLQAAGDRSWLRFSDIWNPNWTLVSLIFDSHLFLVHRCGEQHARPAVVESSTGISGPAGPGRVLGRGEPRTKYVASLIVGQTKLGPGMSSTD